jgi:dTDP-4-amino-4,6-dideoxygalactose transaminase
LKYVDKAIEKRKQIAEYYRENLIEIKGIKFLNDINGAMHSYSYFPILINEEEYGKSRDCLYENLKKHHIFTRRYFYPLISQFPAYRELESALPGKLPIAEKTATEVLCLPIYPDLNKNIVKFICHLINNKI